MQGCANDFGKLIGKVAVLRMALGCPDTVPALSEWKRLGAMTTKGFDYSMNTVTSEADDSKGLVENLVNNMDFTISGDGEFRKKDKGSEFGAIRMAKYIFDEVQAGRQPTVWVRFDFAGEDAGTYIMGYFNTTSWSGDFGTSDISTYSGEWKVYDADTVVFKHRRSNRRNWRKRDPCYCLAGGRVNATAQRHDCTERCHQQIGNLGKFRSGYRDGQHHRPGYSSQRGYGNNHRHHR